MKKTHRHNQHYVPMKKFLVSLILILAASQTAVAAIAVLDYEDIPIGLDEHFWPDISGQGYGITEQRLWHSRGFAHKHFATNWGDDVIAESWFAWAYSSIH